MTKREREEELRQRQIERKLLGKEAEQEAIEFAKKMKHMDEWQTRLYMDKMSKKGKLAYVLAYMHAVLMMPEEKGNEVIAEFFDDLDKEAIKRN